jgi:hypothetical protein
LISQSFLTSSNYYFFPTRCLHVCDCTARRLGYETLQPKVRRRWTGPAAVCGILRGWARAGRTGVPRTDTVCHASAPARGRDCAFWKQEATTGSKKRIEHSLQSIIHHDRAAAQPRPKLPPAFHASPSPRLIMHSSRSRCSRPPTRIATRACGP